MKNCKHCNLPIGKHTGLELSCPPTTTFEELRPFCVFGLCNAQLSRGDSDLCTRKAGHKGLCDPDANEKP